MNTQVSTYLEDKPLKFHEIEMLNLISKNYDSEQNFSFLDVGCATGVFIKCMSDKFFNASFTGIDPSEELINKAIKYDIKRAVFIKEKSESFEPETKFDCLLASGVLSIFDDYCEPLKSWLSWLKPDGKLFIFGRFNSEHIDTKVYFKNYFPTPNPCWESGLNVFSIRTISSFLKEMGYKSTFMKFELPVKVNKHPDPIRTFTLELSNGENLVVNGANTIAEHFFAEIERI